MSLETQFTIQDVADFYARLDKLGIDIWVDGGWAVDALLGEQTRPHGDIDIVIERKDTQTLRDALEADGYYEEMRDDTREVNFVLRDDAGHRVDFHVIVLDDEGNGQYEKGFMFPAESLTGQGVIGGRKVRCISPKWLVSFHTGYELRESDVHDVTRLCEKFDIPLPDEYRQYVDNA